ncbi:polyprotein of EF-Ts, chloroplastic [Mercurialis annua]|uniref:polyprotein of EF-Ts, chloroplastic n=1 Tax=Mercurialis annua TaxID=3986 RepID=UPI00215FEFA9|nr:polyprotein of EF-Ts, chloroplastic [Mercurialis annua]
MTTIVPCSTSNISLIPGAAFTVKKHNHLTRSCFPRKSSNRLISSQRHVLALPTSVGFFPKYRRDYGWLHRAGLRVVSATGTDTDVVVKEPELPVADENSGETSDGPADAVEPIEKSSIKSDTNRAPAQVKRSRPGRKSEMPPVKNEDLIPGASFTGKVRSVQPFGAFVDFGAFTDGLVHVSKLSNSFVKDVASVVSVGQEVTVRLVEANSETGRISLTMRDDDDPNKVQQQNDDPTTASRGKPRPARRNAPKSGQRRDDSKTSKFVIGQELGGTVKNLTRSGSFITLPEGGEGFLPQSEEYDGGIQSMMGDATLEIGQEVSVKVLRISRGQVTLTMKKEEKESNAAVFQGVVHSATNPFLLAFRKNKDIASFLDAREQMGKVAVESKTPVEVEEQEKQIETISDVPEVQDQPSSSDVGSVSDVSTVVGEVEEEDMSSKEVDVEPSVAGDDQGPESIESSSSQIVEDAVQSEEQAEESSGISDLKGAESGEISSEIVSPTSPVGEEVIESPLADAVTNDGEVQSEELAEESSGISDLKGAESGEISSEIVSPTSPVGEEAIASPFADAVTNDGEQTQIPETSSFAPTENENTEATIPDENGSITGSEEKADVSPPQEAKEESDKTSETSGSTDVVATSSETQDDGQVIENLVESTKDEVETQTSAAEAEIPSAKDEVETQASAAEAEIPSAKDEVETQASAAEAEIPSAIQVEKNGNVEPALEQSDSITNVNGQSDSPSTDESAKATISPALVKQLREESGAGMMDCKKALSEAGGDIVKAQEFLRKKGLASADKKASRKTAEGRIGSYIHDSRIGVLVEVNCETDFVSRGEIFKELVDDIAMQVAACPQVQYLVTEDVPEELVNKEKEIEMQKEDLMSKPEQIRSKIVEGRIKKRLDELALLEQPFIKNDKIVVKDMVKQTIATIGENIKVKRFVRFNLGEGLEKRSQDFAAEVAAQTTAKPVTAPAKEQPASAETNEPAEKPAAVAISAALVKQLREESGAGMMDCKKALSETGGDLEKAQEYLRKKGLAAADKKSSRIAAEGRIGSYIHDSRIGVLIEVNCETDFVGRSEKFKELVNDLAMQVVACPQVQFVSVDEISESFVKKEKELEMQREDLASKPENIREKIVDGRISKRLGELALLEQPYIKDDSILVKDLVKQSVAAIGENIKVRRFVRFTLGENVEDAKPKTEA